MKLTFPISLCLVLFVSCQKHSLFDLQGDWVGWMSYPFSEIDEFRIQGDSIFLSDRYNHNSKGMVQLDGDSLRMDFGIDEKYSFAISQITDSSFVLDNAAFDRYALDDFWEEVPFEFIDIDAISTNSYEFAWGKIYYYRNKNGDVELHSGETNFGFSDLSRYLRRPVKESKKNMVPTVLVGKGIDLVDVQILLEYIRVCGYQRVKLMTKRDGIGQYQSVELNNVRFEEYQINLSEKLVKFGVPQMPPMPPPISVMEILNYGGFEVKIRSVADFNLLEKGDFRKPMVVLVNSEMSMELYIQLQLYIAQILEKRMRQYYQVII